MDSVITDPPGGISFMGKLWDNLTDHKPRTERGRQVWLMLEGMISLGYLQRWEAGFLYFTVDWATQALRVSKPGGPALVWAIPRTSDLTKFGLRLAGWEIRDTIYHLFGSGFPKSHDISKAIDKAAGAEREVVGPNPHSCPGRKPGAFHIAGGNHRDQLEARMVEQGIDKPPITSPATDAAQLWDDWGTALKPAAEEWIVAMKPREGTFAENALAWGVAGLNIDGTRIATHHTKGNGAAREAMNYCDGEHIDAGSIGDIFQMHNAVALDRILDTLLQSVECEPLRALLSANDGWYAVDWLSAPSSLIGCPSYHRFCDALFHQLEEGDRVPETLRADVLRCIHPCEHWGDLVEEPSHSPCYAETFLPSSWDAPRRTLSYLASLYESYSTPDIQPHYTTPNIQSQGRWPANLVLSHTPECDGSCAPGCPVAMLDEMSGELKSGGYPPEGGQRSQVATYGKPNCRGEQRFTSSTGGASRFFYTAKASRTEREAGLLGRIPCLKCGGLDTETHIDPKTGKVVKCRRNGHPTVKPLELMRWLCRLTATPTGGVVLDPFMGSGRTGVAAVLEGREFIGIEIEEASYDIARCAIAWAEEQVPQAVQGVLL